MVLHISIGLYGLSPWYILFTVYQMSTHTCAHGNPETTEPRVITNSNLNTICVYMCTYVQAFTQMKANKIHTDALCTVSVVILNRVHKDRQIDRYFLLSDTSSQHFMSACQTCLFIEIIEHALIPCKCRAKMETREKQVWKERA